jgi:hypothetical protein
MRTSVGPLPAAVYWRRRAVVLGALLVGVLVLFLSCSGEDKSDQRGTGAEKLPGSGAGVAAPTPEIEPSFEDAPPGGGPALPDPSDVLADPNGGVDGDPLAGASAEPNVNAGVPTGHCADTEVSVTPVPARAAVKRGTTVELRLKIKNISTRACSRDVGADLQEIYLKRGARKVWSSDICGLAKGSQLLNFAPNREREYNVTWNGRAATKCAGGSAAGPFPLAGEYQLFGRLGGKVSAPVRMVITT